MASSTTYGRGTNGTCFGGRECGRGSGPSALVAIMVGMGAMILLVLAALMLLCRSMWVRRRQENGTRSHGSGRGAGEGGRRLEEEEEEGGGGPSDVVVLVVQPGEKHAVGCARVWPMDSMQESAGEGGGRGAEEAMTKLGHGNGGGNMGGAATIAAIAAPPEEEEEEEDGTAALPEEEEDLTNNIHR